MKNLMTTETQVNLNELGFELERETEKAQLFKRPLQLGKLPLQEVTTKSENKIAYFQQIWLAKRFTTDTDKGTLTPLWTLKNITVNSEKVAE